jgi:hypothetical protein
MPIFAVVGEIACLQQLSGNLDDVAINCHRGTIDYPQQNRKDCWRYIASCTCRVDGGFWVFTNRFRPERPGTRRSRHGLLALHALGRSCSRRSCAETFSPEIFLADIRGGYYYRYPDPCIALGNLTKNRNYTNNNPFGQAHGRASKKVFLSGGAKR